MGNKQTPAVVFFVLCVLIAVALFARKKTGGRETAPSSSATAALPADDWSVYDDQHVRFSYPKGWTVNAIPGEDKSLWSIVDEAQEAAGFLMNGILIESRKEDRSLDGLYAKQKEGQPEAKDFSAAMKVRLAHGQCLRYEGREFIDAICYSSGGKYYKLGVLKAYDPDTGGPLKAWTAGRHFERILPTIEFK